MASRRHAHLPHRSLTARWLALLIGLVGVVIAGLLCHALWRQERARVVDIVALETANVRTDLSDLLKDNIQALERMASRWVLRGGTPQKEWEADVATYVQHHPECRAFAWVDTSLHIRWVAPMLGNEAAIGRDLTAEQWRRQALERAHQQHNTTLTHTVELAQGGAGVLVFVPLYIERRFDGFLLGEFRLQELLTPIAKGVDAAGYALALFEGTREVYAHVGHGRQLEARWAQEVTMLLPNQGPRWRLRLWPSTEKFKQIQSALPLITLVVGLVGSGLFAFTGYLASITSQRAREVQVMNDHLAAEMTERHAAEVALRESEQRFRTLVEGSIQGIIIHRDGVPLFANQAYADIFGYANPSEVLQKEHAILQMAVPHEHVRLLDYLQTRLPGEETSTPSEFQGVRQDGSLLWIAAVANRVNWEGTPAIQCAIMDITEQKQAQEEVLRARKIESVGILAGGIAHDFNNLLTGIMGNISFATTLLTSSDRTLHDKVVKRLAAAEQACQRATALTQQLLTFAKGGAPVRQTIAMADLLHEVITFTLRGANVRAEFAIAEDLWPVDVDAGQMYQVIHNVVLNAVQAMPGGGIIQVQADNLDTPMDLGLPLQQRPYMQIAIQDHGSGISPEMLPNIFDPYFTTKTGGNGLGLATAHAIVSKHDGYMTVTSRVGEGTTFYIYLPASQHTIEPVRVPSSQLVAASGRILVMDDDELICDLLSEILTSMGYEVDCVGSGAEAVAMYQQALATGHVFTAAILDITIPGGMGGIDTMAQLRLLDPQVKAIVSSGYANNSVMAHFQDYGFSGMVVKPYTVQKLQDVLQDVLHA